MARKQKDVEESTEFNYEEAFSRTIGWITKTEQQILKNKRVAIAGLGGVGGVHLLTLLRLGIQKFNIADADSFESVNFNRQVGATISSIGQPKVSTLEEMAKDINPHVELKTFPEGVTEDNLDEFLKDVDLYVDGLDFFVLDIRRKVFKRCAELEIPAITAAPLGMGTAYLTFLPGKMTFEQYFCFEGLSTEQQYINFLIGLTPKAAHRHYLVDPTAINFAEKRGPSTIMACQLCAGIIGTESIKILLNRGPVYAAPYYHLFDAYQQKHHRGYLLGGNRHPLQILKRKLVHRSFVNRSVETIKTHSKTYQTVIEKILDLARWAPSGDNNQPWRFSIKNTTAFTIHVTDDSDTDIYDFTGIPSLISTGSLLENIGIAATQFGYTVNWSYQKLSEHEHNIEVKLLSQKALPIDSLLPFMSERSVDRRRYQLKKMTQKQKKLLELALGDEFGIEWLENFKQRWDMSKVNALSTDIRLRVPELYAVHQKVLKWQEDFSTEGIPVKATGLSSLSQKLMFVAVKTWSRVNFLNRYFGAPHSTALELDLIPGVFSAAHFVIYKKENSQKDLSAEEALRFGQSLQRFWLVATQLGLVMQPCFAPLCFSYYAEKQINFTQDNNLINKAKKLAAGMQKLCGKKQLVFKGRIGCPAYPNKISRSIRKPLDELIINSDK